MAYRYTRLDGKTAYMNKPQCKLVDKLKVNDNSWKCWRTSFTGHILTIVSLQKQGIIRQKGNWYQLTEKGLEICGRSGKPVYSVFCSWVELRERKVLDRLLDEKYGIVENKEWDAKKDKGSALVMDLGFAKLLADKNPDMKGVLKELGVL